MNEKIFYVRIWANKQTKPSNKFDFLSFRKQQCFSTMRQAEKAKASFAKVGYKSDIVVLDRYLFVEP